MHMSTQIRSDPDLRNSVLQDKEVWCVCQQSLPVCHSEPPETFQEWVSSWRWVWKPANKGIRLNKAGERPPEKTTRSWKNTLRNKIWAVASGDRTPWLPFIKSLFTLAGKMEPQRNGLPQERLMQPREKPGSCCQRPFVEIWRGIGVTRRWQSDVLGTWRINTFVWV